MDTMAMVRMKEEQAEAIAHILDDIVRLPGTHVRMGADPLLGLIPIVGDAVAALFGAAILVVARQLNVPWPVVGTMAFNQLKNGLIGAVPIIGDVYSFYFKSNAVNAALLLRAVKRGEQGACLLTTHSLTIQDLARLAALILSAIALVGFVSFWFWDHNISLLSILFFQHFYQRWEG
jgi:hypothetical protein